MSRETAMAAAMKAAGLDPDIVELRLLLAKLINHGRVSEGVCHREVSAAYAKSSEAKGAMPQGQPLLASSRPPLPGTANSPASQDHKEPAAPRHPESEAAARALSSDRTAHAALRPQSDEAGQIRGANPAGLRLPTSSPPSELPGEAPASVPEGQAGIASSRQPNDAAGQHKLANPALSAAPAASPKRLVPYAGKEPSAIARKVMGSVAKQLAKVTVGYRVRDGRYLTDIKRGELRRLAQENRDEATVLQAVITVLNTRHPDGDQLKTVGELLEPDDLRRTIAGAQDIEHA